MSFVAALQADKLDYLPQALSASLLGEHADSIARINAHLNRGIPVGQATEHIVKILNDRVEKDVTQAYCDRGFPSIETMIKLGMLRMNYVPAAEKDTLELLYRTMLMGALKDYAVHHPAYQLEAGKQMQSHETGIADAYRRVTGCAEDAAVEYMLSLRAALDKGCGQSR